MIKAIKILALLAAAKLTVIAVKQVNQNIVLKKWASISQEDSVNSVIELLTLR
ncbi:MAG: hypothetical protein F6I01_002310 [Aerococcus sanguinicola]|uniref:hypothetical protein n=1 Tax=Aerococcus sp. HMSC062A02 TaxID=1715105 RepID=UPI00143C171E|nr:hypothetical protein [Aerococcus sp. HMSC062A02]